MRTLNKQSKSEFELNKCVVIRNVLEKQSQLFLFNYIKFMAERYYLIKDTLPDYYNERVIGFEGDDVPGAYSRYGDPFIETVLLTLKEEVELETGLELIPTYSFFRLYTKGDELLSHKDRPECEISASLCAGYVGDEPWPIFMEERPVYLEAGDMVVYRGGGLSHWRKPLEGEMQAQIFLHWNDINGPYGKDNLYDHRIFLGLPKVTENANK